jgi:hypothetical protein
MQREVLTHPLTEPQLQEELRHFVEFYSAQGIAACNVLFGSAWGNEYYPTKDWLEEQVSLRDLIAKVKQVEVSGYGRLGSDDLFLKLPGLEFLFCNDSDIHIAFSDSHPDIEYFFQRWKKLGFKPAEWLKAERHGPGEKVRDA